MAYLVVAEMTAANRHSPRNRRRLPEDIQR